MDSSSSSDMDSPEPEMDHFLYIGNLTVSKDLGSFAELKQAIANSFGGDLLARHDTDYMRHDNVEISNDEMQTVEMLDDDLEIDNTFFETNIPINQTVCDYLNESVVFSELDKEDIKKHQSNESKELMDSLQHNGNLDQYCLYDQDDVRKEQFQQTDQNIETEAGIHMKEATNMEFLVIKPELLLDEEVQEDVDENYIGYHFLSQLQQTLLNTKPPDCTLGTLGTRDTSNTEHYSTEDDVDLYVKDKRRYKCPLCSYSKTYHMGVKRHIFVHHPEIDSELSPGQRLYCKLCDKRYYDPRHLEKHMISSHGSEI